MASLDFDREKEIFRNYCDEKRENLHGALNSFKILIESLLLSVPDISISSIDGRVKDREECIRKFTRKYRTDLEQSKTPYTIKEKITDLIGLRIVCLYEDDVERIKDAISKEFHIIHITDKIAQVEGTEDSFGYKGLHLDLSLNENRKKMTEYKIYSENNFELQIRTVVQDSWSIIDHKIKYKKSIPNSLKRRINTLAALFELADREFRAIRDATFDELKNVDQDYEDIESESDNGAKSDATINYQNLDYNLNAFNFLRIAKHFFPDFDFEPSKVDGFTQKIISARPYISRGKFNYYMKENVSVVKRYQAYFESEGNSMNPYTIIRHCLYLGDQKIFRDMLTDVARTNFKKWLKEQNEGD